MPIYTIRDKTTGKTARLRGDSPPTQEEQARFFDNLASQGSQAPQAIPQRRSGDAGIPQPGENGNGQEAAPFIDFGKIGRNIFGLGETAVQLGTGALAEPTAGLAGAVAAPFVGSQAAEEIIGEVREAQTFQPRTEAGQEISQQVGGFLAPAGKLISAAETALGDKVFKETGSPVLAAAATTLPSLALELIGIKIAKGSVKKGQTKASQKLNNDIDKALLASAPGIEQLKQVSGAVFDEISDLGVTIKPEAFNQISTRIAELLRKEGADPRITPQASGAVQAFQETAERFAGQPIPLREFEILRKLAQNVAGNIDAPTRRLGNILIDEIDSFIDSAGTKALNFPKGEVDLAGLYRKARKLWGQGKKGEVMAEVMDKARSQQSGFENGMRIQIRQLLQNKKKIKFFSAAEQDLMRKAIRGTKISNIARFIGKLSPIDGISSRALNSMAGASTGAFFTQTLQGGVILPTIGFVGSKFATFLTKGKADFIDAVVRAGSNGREITRVYFAKTPKKLRNAEDLSTLLLRQDIDLSNLPKDAITTQAIDLAQKKRAGLISATGGVAGVQSIKNDQQMNQQENPFQGAGQEVINGPPTGANLF